MSGHAGSIKSPPYSVHSEKLVLQALARQPELLPEVRAILPAASAFFRPEHVRQYAALLADPAAPRVAPPPPGGTDDEPPSSESALEHARIVADKANMRRLIDAVSDIIHDAYHGDDGFEAILRRSRKRLDALRPPRPGSKSRSKKSSSR